MKLRFRRRSGYSEAVLQVSVSALQNQAAAVVLNTACVSEDIDVVAMLLRRGVELNYEEDDPYVAYTLLCTTSCFSYLSIGELFSSYQSQRSHVWPGGSWKSLQAATARRHYEVVRRLVVDDGADLGDIAKPPSLALPGRRESRLQICPAARERRIGCIEEDLALELRRSPAMVGCWRSTSDTVTWTLATNPRHPESLLHPARRQIRRIRRSSFEGSRSFLGNSETPAKLLASSRRLPS